VRTLKVLGFKTLFARNITDVDDKIIKKMNESGKSLAEITEFYYQSYKNDLHELNCLSPDLEPKATENIDEMAQMVQKLLDDGYAYRISSGDIYFDTSKDRKYLSLSSRNSDEMQSRIDGESEKKDSKDFVLWKAKTENDTLWFDSIIGAGRPGWHLECSAMINKHLASENTEYQIDIHGGGIDLLFPHHENECAQSRCAFGKELSRLWMHNGFVTINSEKMSKSLGNGFSLNEAISIFGGEYVRNYLLQTHYRQNFNFSHDDLIASKKRLDRIYRLKKRVNDIQDGMTDENFKKKFLDALTNDLNISEAFALVEEFIANSNELLDKNPKDKGLKASIKASLATISDITGLGYKNSTEHFQQGVSEKEKKLIEQLINERSEAKKAKDYKTADDIRQKLIQIGINIMDNSEGTVWEKV
jgi:cysteinyl-tRNA synthetase